jgi:hypothetical protein
LRWTKISQNARYGGFTSKDESPYHARSKRRECLYAGATSWNRGRDVKFRISATIQIGLISVILAACNPGAGTQPQIASTPDTSNVDQTVLPQVIAPPPPPPPPPLVYSWNTEFSGFLSPPIEVRRMARDDCLAAGYEIATVETMALQANIATVTFICRGDFE